ncbi:MAG: hypothetical protein NT154_35150 [Verrucomicrobia bacterium]|nr:hypothetical protein [Verrucomicrobiota bacterium]
MRTARIPIYGLMAVSGEIGATGFPHDECGCQGEASSWQGWLGNPLDHRAKGDHRNVTAGLVNGRQRD